MKRATFGALLGVLLLASQAFGLDASGTLQSVDPDTGVIVVLANGADRTLKATKATQFLDAGGKPLANGIRAVELKKGTAVTVTVDVAGGNAVLKVLRLGAPGDGPSTGRPSIGQKPLDEMAASDRYKGEDGGLYGGGRNEPPAAHLAAALAESAKIVPLGPDGKPSKAGIVALVSISMSNATQEFSVFKADADADPVKSARLTIVDCAQGGQAMAQWVDPRGRAWLEADRRLEAAKVSPRQVQVAWIKLANVMPTGDLAEHGRKLEKDTLAVLHDARDRFPNLRIAYLGSRIYGGWSTGRLNPEPYAYEGAFAVRWLIEGQIKGAADLNFDPARGKVVAPLLLWGPYLWADGVTPRKSDGLVWERADVGDDGVHPTVRGREKVAQLLRTFFKSHATSKAWFLN